MSRFSLTLLLGLVTALFSVGFAQKAQAGITINSITGVPNPVPAAGAFAPVLIDCGGVDEVPTGDATLTSTSTGQVVSHNSVAYYQDDSSGNPIVYAYVVFPVNHTVSNNVGYSLVITVHGSDGSSDSRTMALVQGLKAPITINSITPNPSVLQATTPSVIVSADLTANGTNQAGYQSGVAFLLDSAGNTLDVQAFQGAPVPDGSGSYIYKTYALSHIPANTSASARTFTISVQVKDNTGVWSYASVPLTQLAGSTAPAAASFSLLWTCRNGQASLWRMQGDTSSHLEYGPYSGWTAMGVSDGPGGVTHILWTRTDGQVSLWNVSDSGVTSQEYGPYTGWSAVSLSTGGDGVTRLLWDRTDGQASLWAIGGSGESPTHAEYGPFAGWTANAVAAGREVTDLLWTSRAGMMSGWKIATNGSVVHAECGPYPQWSATALSVGPDGAAHLLWDNVNGASALWNVDFATGSFTQSAYGPFGGWSAKAVATGSDAVTHLLWNHAPDGQASVWNIGSGSATNREYGPFPGWTAVALSARP